MSELGDIVDRAIDYTGRILTAAPSYRDAAVSGLRKLRDALAQRAPNDPALERLDAYIAALSGRGVREP